MELRVPESIIRRESQELDLTQEELDILDDMQDKYGENFLSVLVKLYEFIGEIESVYKKEPNEFIPSTVEKLTHNTKVNIFLPHLSQFNMEPADLNTVLIIIQTIADRSLRYPPTNGFTTQEVAIYRGKAEKLSQDLKAEILKLVESQPQKKDSIKTIRLSDDERDFLRKLPKHVSLTICTMIVNANKRIAQTSDLDIIKAIKAIALKRSRNTLLNQAGNDITEMAACQTILYILERIVEQRKTQLGLN